MPNKMIHCEVVRFKQSSVDRHELKDIATARTAGTV